MLSREVMKAAESVTQRMEDLSSPSWPDIEVMADHILTHRADYSKDGTPLPNNDAFLQSLGMTRDRDEVWSHPSVGGWFILRHDGSVQYYAEVYDLGVLKTRPQLRALIEAMGK